MSTKIFTGLKTDITDIFELNFLLGRYADIVKPKIEEKILNRIAFEITTQHDRYILSLIDEEPNLGAFSIYLDIQRAHTEAQGSMERDPYSDYMCHIAMYPFKDKTLLTCNSDHPLFFDDLKELERIEEYGYWNNTDKPSNISDKEWDLRKKDWDQAFESTRLEFLPIDPYILPVEMEKLRTIETYFVSQEERANKMAGEIVLKEYAELYRNDPSKGKFASSIFTIIRSDEYKARKKEVVEEIIDRLTDVNFFKKMIS